MKIGEEKTKEMEQVRIQFKKKFHQLEIEIDVFADNAADIDKEMDVSKHYLPLIHTYHWESGAKYIIDETWRALISKIEDIIMEASNHVKKYTKTPFVIKQYRLIPMKEKCNQDDLCKKCLLKQNK